MSAPDFPLLAKVRHAARRLRGAWLALPCVLGALAGPVAAEDPPFVPTLTKVMSYSEIIGSGTFGGDVSINAYGKWIAASPKGIFISNGTANTTWQQAYDPLPRILRRSVTNSRGHYPPSVFQALPPRPRRQCL